MATWLVNGRADVVTLAADPRGCAFTVTLFSTSPPKKNPQKIRAALKGRC